MTDDMPRRYERVEVLSGVQRRRRWTPEEKIRMVEETYLPGMSVSLVARQHGVGVERQFRDVHDALAAGQSCRRL